LKTDLTIQVLLKTRAAMEWTELRINDFRIAPNFSLQPSGFKPDQAA
jgi:hypothetical protein